MDDLGFDDLLRSCTVFVATGNTYKYKDEFVSWAWHWNPQRKAWVEANGSKITDAGIQAIIKLPGVTVTQEHSHD